MKWIYRAALLLLCLSLLLASVGADKGLSGHAVINGHFPSLEN